jgi:two-component system phosphate regulon response regulator OmpR
VSGTPDGSPLDDAAHLLVVDDDKRIRDLLARYLADQGFRVTTAVDAASARAAMRGLAFDLVVLDVMMPGESGVEFAAWLKREAPLPILMLTARAEPGDRIEGLEAGVDDYLPKPFEPRELLLRIRNVLRRGRSAGAGHASGAEELHMGPFVFHVGRGELKRGDETIRLTERERDLLRQFGARAGAAIPRHELAKDGGSAGERAVDVQINRLRAKIESDPANPVYLQTVRGKGYVLYTD